MVVFQLVDILFFEAVAVFVAQLVKARAVIHFGEVGEFVPHDVVAQMLGHKHEHI